MARVRIREKLLSDGKASLILDYRDGHGNRRKDTLRIYVNPAHKKSRDTLERRAYEEAYATAEVERLRVEQRLMFAEHDIPQKQKSIDKKLSFLDYFDKKAEKKSPTWGSVGNHLKRFAKGQLPLASVNDEWIARFQSYLQTKVSDSAVHTYMGIVTACLNQAVREKLIPTNPSRNVPKVHGKEVKLKYLTKEELERIIVESDGFPDWFLDAFLFSCYTGLRISDVETLTWAHITKETRDGKTRFGLVKRQVKTDDFVYMPLSPKALEILQRQKRNDQPESKQELIFKLKSRTTVKRLITKWRKQTGLSFTYHSSRHTFGTMLQTAGVDINTTSKLMGHKGINMTLRYAQVIDPAKEVAISKLDSFLQ